MLGGHSLPAAGLQLSLDFILFAVFLGTNLIIGWLAGRRVGSLQGFAIGNKDFSTPAVTSTIVATWIGGGFMFYALQNIYTNGLLFIIPLLGSTFCLVFTGRVLAPRMGEFLHSLSVAEAMGELFGPIVRVITAACGALGSIGYVAIQFQVMGKILSFLLGIQGPGVTIAAALIVILYSSFGGIRSVTITDIFQFIAFSIFIPLLGLIVWNHLKDPSKVVDTLTTNSIFSLSSVLADRPKLLGAVGLLLYFAIPGLTPAIFQRVAIAKNLDQVQKSFTYAGLLTLLVNLSVAWIAVLLLAANPNLEPSGLVNYMITTYAYPGLKGLIAVGITAMAMSTADSDLNAATVLVVHDLIKPIRPSWQESMKLLRLISLLLGGCGILMALHTHDLLELVLLAGSVYMPIVTVPLLLAIFGFRSSGRAVLIGMSAGLVTVLVWNSLFGHLGIDRLIPGMVANLVFLVGSHYILKEKGGWVDIKDPAYLTAARQKRADLWRKLVSAIKELHLYTYLKSNLPSKELVHTLFGLYALGSTYACFFTIPEATVAAYQKLYYHIAHSVITVTACFITYPAWPAIVKKRGFIAFAWPAGMCYILFVVGSVFVILSGFHQVQVMLFILNMVLAALLIDWPLLLVVVLTGIMLAIGAFYLYVGGIPNILSEQAVQFRALYGLPLLISLLLAIISFRRSKKSLVAQKEYLLEVHKEDQARLVELASFQETLLKELNQDEFDQVTLNYLKQAIYRVRDYLRLEVSKLGIDELVRGIRSLVDEQSMEPAPQLVFELNTSHEVIQADVPKIKKLLASSIGYLQACNPLNIPLIISLEDTQLGYEISHMPDHLRKIDAIRIIVSTTQELPALQEVYLAQEAAVSGSSLASGGFQLLENARIIDAHYGYLDQSRKDMHLYVIPVHVREVRGKVMELLEEPAAADPDELAHQLAIKLEKDLLAKLQDTDINLHLIHHALEVIKKYHGGVKRLSGEPYFTHPLAVALIVLEHSKDQDAVIGALLHDLLEDTSLSLSYIEAMYGERVGFIVSKVTCDMKSLEISLLLSS